MKGSRNATADGVPGTSSGWRYVPHMGKREKVIKRARRAIRDGKQPTFEVDVARRVVPALPWLEFDGSRPPEIAEAARRSIAAEVGVRPHEILVEHIEVIEEDEGMVSDPRRRPDTG